MKKQSLLMGAVLVGVAILALSALADEERKDSKPIYAVVGGQPHALTPFPNDSSTQRIIKQTQIEREASALAAKGLYEEALYKYRDAVEPSLIEYENDKAIALSGIRDIHQRQGKYEEALKDHEWFLKANPAKTEYQDKRLELLSLLEWQKTGSPQTVHDHIRYLREKYKDFLPPGRKYEAIFTGSLISTIAHLYNHIGDADGGVEFMDEVLDWRAFHPDQRAEYEHVRQAFEEDKRTGQRGHLRKALETSSFISW